MMRYFILLASILMASCQTSTQHQTQTLKVATFNVSMEASNYVKGAEIAEGPKTLMARLATGKHQQIANIAEILQRTRPDIVLLNEFDYIENPKLGVQAFVEHYLKREQNGASAIDYPYFYYAPSNTGLPTSFDLNNNGKQDFFASDAQGFGQFHGHYAMVLLSKYPIVASEVRTFQRFLWSDMPNAIVPIDPDTKQPWYDEQEWASIRLSSKSHWDVPVDVNGQIVHVLASHPTPPVFDGPDDHNGARNHDEVRFWLDYISPGQGDYIYDDNKSRGGLSDNELFVVLGDLNASPVESDGLKGAIRGLIQSPLVNGGYTPSSEGARLNKPDNPHAVNHTAHWGVRADYVLPSRVISIVNGGVFWPTQQSPLYRLIADRKASSDHRMVWLELSLP